MIKPFHLCLAAATTICITAPTSADNHAHDAEAIAAALTQREHDWVDAMRARDIESLDQILADEFSLSFHAMGFTLPKAGWLANLHEMSFGEVTMSNIEVNVISDTLVTLSMQMSLEEWQVGENTAGANYDITDIWVLRDGRWQAKMRISNPHEEEAGGRRGPNPQATMEEFANSFLEALNSMDWAQIEPLVLDDIRYYLQNGEMSHGKNEFEEYTRLVKEKAPELRIQASTVDVHEFSPVQAILSVSTSVIAESEGENFEASGLMTMVLKRPDGPWRVAILHESVQFHTED